MHSVESQQTLCSILKLELIHSSESGVTRLYIPKDVNRVRPVTTVTTELNLAYNDMFLYLS
jgi:hypothetical protein